MHTIVAGDSHIDHADVVGAGATQTVLGHRVMAPSMLGTFLRSSPSAVSTSSRRWWARVLSRAWAAGAGPGSARVVVLRRLDVRYTMAVRTTNTAVASAIAAEECPLWFFKNGEAARSK